MRKIGCLLGCFLFIVLSSHLAAAQISGTITGTVTCSGCSGGGPIYISVLDGPFGLGSLLGGTGVPAAAQASFTISNVLGLSGDPIYVYAFWDANGSADPLGPIPDAGDIIGEALGNPLSLAPSVSHVEIPLADTAGSGYTISGQVTSSIATGSETGPIYVFAYEGPQSSLGEIFAVIQIAPPLPANYTLSSILGNPGDTVYVGAFWDVGDSGMESGPTLGDYFGVSPASPLVLSGTDTGIDIDLNTVNTNPNVAVSGNVSDEEGPMAGVQVQVFDAPCGGNMIASGITDTDGHYIITGVPPNSVFVRACPTCTNLPYIDSFYGSPDWAPDSCSRAQPVVAPSGATASGIDFFLKEGPQILQFLDLMVSNGTLYPGFMLMPWAADYLESAVVRFPNPARSDYTFDLVADKLNWDSECRYLPNYWGSDMGLVQPEDYGEYTLILTFKDGSYETYTGTLEARALVAANADPSITVQSNGDLTVTWTHADTPEPDQKWQVRVREGASGPGREVFRSSSQPSTTTTVTIPAGDLGCVEYGAPYRVRVRSWSFDDSRAETVEKVFTYNPAAAGDRYSWLWVARPASSGNLELGFDVRPASRDEVISATVAWPGGAPTYSFDLEHDWYDLSSDTRFNRGWFRSDPSFPVVDGDYTFTINYSDGPADVVIKSFTDQTFSGIDPSSMQAMVNSDGSVQFSWELPPASNLKYHIRVRSKDPWPWGSGSKEYLKSGSVTDANQIWASAYDLRGLVPGRMYSWHVRVEDMNSMLLDRSLSSYFYYDPFGIAGPGEGALHFFEVAAFNGTLSPSFSVIPAFRDALVGAYLKIPNPGRAEYPEYPFDLANDRLIWDSECRYLDFWTADFGSVQPDDYGVYTLVLVFEIGDPGDTDTFIQSYEFELDEAAVTPASQASIGVSVPPDGSVTVNWAPEAAIVPGQVWQVRVREAATNREVFRSSNLSDTATSFAIPAEDLKCVDLGGNYKWLVRAYDPDRVRVETRLVEAVYNPGAFPAADRVTSLYIADHRGILGVHFDVRPADRNRVLFANISGPGVSYDYDLVADFDDMSTETRINRGWWHGGGAADITDGGLYTLTVRIDENGNGIYEAGTDTEVVIDETLTQTPLTNIDGNSMASMIYPDGAMDFSWALPDGVTGQYYQVRIRNMDHSKEYVKTDSAVDMNQVHLSSWDLRALLHGQQYIWFVRIFDDDFDTMVQRPTQTFYYDPFYLYSEPIHVDPQTAIQNGLQWLRDNQNTDGSWGDLADQASNRLGATEFAVMAFLNHGVEPGDPDVAEGLTYILSNAQPIDPSDGDWNDGAITAPDGMAMNYTTAIGVLALIAADRYNNPRQYTDVISNGVNKIIQMQNTEDTISDPGYGPSDAAYGGWSYGTPWPNQNGAYWADMSNSQWDILALYEAKPVVNPAIVDPLDIDQALDRAIVFLQHCQNRPATNDLAWAHVANAPSYDDGGLLYNPNPDSMPPDSDWMSYSQTISTYAGIWGYTSTGVLPGDPRVDDALAWASQDNNFALWYGWMNRPYYAYYTAAKALTLTGEAGDTVNPNWRENLTQQLLFYQEDDGRWKNISQGQEGGDPLTTAYALLSLGTGQDSPTSTLAITISGNAVIAVTKPDDTIASGTPDVNFPAGEVTSGTYIIDVTGTSDGSYALDILGTDGNQSESIGPLGGPIDNGEIQRYEVVVTYITGFRVALVNGPVSTIPAIEITAPDGAVVADDVFRIAWVDSDIDSNAIITLYYDTNQTVGGGIQIAAGISEDDANFLDWDVSGLGAAGPYYIYGTITDGIDTNTGFSAGTVTVAPDGMPKDWEKANGLDLYRDDSAEDVDGDGLTNKQEYDYKNIDPSGRSTNPRSSDTDGDGLPDNIETGVGNPGVLNPNESDTDNNGTPDGAEDTDGDLFTNAEELTAGTDINDPASAPPVPPGDLNGDRAVDIQDAIQMKDQNGNDTGASLRGFYEYENYVGSWNAGTGSVDFNGIVKGAGYMVDIPSGFWLPPGDYTYVVTHAFGPPVEKTFSYPGQQMVPVIDHNSMSYSWAPDNSTLTLTWADPGGDYDTVRLLLQDNNWDERLVVSLPPGVTQITIPDNVLTDIEGIADIATEMRWVMQTRKNYDDPLSHTYNSARGFDCSQSIPWRP